MNPEEAKTIPLRSDAPFTYTVDGEPFSPPAGATLHFASMAVDTLTLTGLPYGLVGRGSVVTARYRGVKVFQGTPASRTERWGRGSTHFEDVTFEGPWGNLARYVFRQEWGFVSESGGSAARMEKSTAHIVLNVDSDGLPIGMSDQIREIASFAAEKCGFSYADAEIAAGSQVLPADEAFDITCAAAIVRTLRFFPKMIARFDYSDEAPVLKVCTPPSRDADWVQSANVISRSVTRIDHPIVGVEITTSRSSTRIEVGDEVFDSRGFDTQSAGDTESLDCLHVYMPLEGASGSTEYETLDCVGHVKDYWDVSTAKGAAWFWKQYHPRLHGVPQGAITIDQGSVKVVDPIDPTKTVAPFKYLTDLTVGDLRRFGKNAVACRFCCKAKIETGDDAEEDVLLTMDFVTTDAVQRTYTHMVGMSSAEGEALPQGLAQAILDQRSGEIASEVLLVRLPPRLPAVGDAKDGLYLQSMSVDCNDLTAELNFGHPGYISAEDMRDLLSGFRGRSYVSSAIARGDPDQADVNSKDAYGIQPIASTEFSPGVKRKTTIKGDSGSIVLDSKKLESGETAKIREITIYDKDGNPSKLKVVGTEPKPGEAEDEPEEEPEDPHEQKDPHGESSNDPCNPSGDSSGDGSGGGGGAGASGSSSSVDGTESGVSGGAGVSAGEDSGGTSVPGCKCD